MANAKSNKAGPDDIMSPAEMKPILSRAKRGDPVSCVIALTKDKEGVILLDIRRKPKQLMSELKKTAAGLGLVLEATTMRFGHASVDGEDDARLLTFTVNKEAPGAMRSRLLDQVKKAGFGKIEIVTDEGLENDTEQAPAPEAEAAPPPPIQESESEAAPTPPAPPAEETVADAASAAPAEDPQAAMPEAPPTVEPAAETAPSAPSAAEPDITAPETIGAGVDAAALTRTLTDLVRRMVPIIAADPSQGSALKSFATEAQAGIKTGDLAGASRAIDGLKQSLEDLPLPAAPAGNNTPQPAPNMAAFTKARMAWIAARKKVESEVNKLHAEMTSVYDGHGFGADLDKFFHAKVEPVLSSLDERLAHKLDEVTSNTDPEQHAQLVSEAKKIVQNYESYLGKEPLIAKLDDNPFVPLQIEKTLTATLSALSKVIA